MNKKVGGKNVEKSSTGENPQPAQQRSALNANNPKKQVARTLQQQLPKKSQDKRLALIVQSMAQAQKRQSKQTLAPPRQRKPFASNVLRNWNSLKTSTSVKPKQSLQLQGYDYLKNYHNAFSNIMYECFHIELNKYLRALRRNKPNYKIEITPFGQDTIQSILTLQSILTKQKGGSPLQEKKTSYTLKTFLRACFGFHVRVAPLTNQSRRPQPVRVQTIPQRPVEPRINTFFLQSLDPQPSTTSNSKFAGFDDIKKILDGNLPYDVIEHIYTKLISSYFQEIASEAMASTGRLYMSRSTNINSHVYHFVSSNINIMNEMYYKHLTQETAEKLRSFHPLPEHVIRTLMPKFTFHLKNNDKPVVGLINLLNNEDFRTSCDAITTIFGNALFYALGTVNIVFNGKYTQGSEDGLTWDYSPSISICITNKQINISDDNDHYVDDQMSVTLAFHEGSYVSDTNGDYFPGIIVPLHEEQNLNLNPNGTLTQQKIIIKEGFEKIIEQINAHFNSFKTKGYDYVEKANKVMQYQSGESYERLIDQSLLERFIQKYKDISTKCINDFKVDSVDVLCDIPPKYRERFDLQIKKHVSPPQTRTQAPATQGGKPSIHILGRKRSILPDGKIIYMHEAITIKKAKQIENRLLKEKERIKKSKKASKGRR